MNKELKNVLSKTEPSNTNVVWYHPTEGGIIPKVFRGGWQALIQGAAGDNTQVIEWSHTHNMNDYKDAGTYRIKGERTGNPMSDNLPIMNQGSGHTVDGLLYVLDSSLPNGSGKEDDCTITQFLMLSNRVGGQEGDMYMRSAYGVNKDSLTWKPWEKYQTNMEVGCVSDQNSLNPQNPKEILIMGAGLYSCTENGVYSGVYIGPKAAIGSSADVNQKYIETFVMVVINNYAAASNARCITQIKFAVTNEGVFSMEKRSTTPGTISNWSQWESVGGGTGGGLPEGVDFKNPDGSDKYIFGENRDDFGSLSIGSGIVMGKTIRIGSGVIISKSVYIGTGVDIDTFDSSSDTKGVEFSGTSGLIRIGGLTTIGERVHIASGIQITETSDDTFEQLLLQWGYDGCFLTLTYNIKNKKLYFDNSHTTDPIIIGDGASIGSNVTIPDNLRFSIAANILTITDGTNTWKLTAES